MPMINLIHEQRLAQRTAAARTRFFVFGLGTCGAASALGFLFLLFLTGSKEADCSQMRAKLVSLRPTVEQIKADEELLGKMRPRMSTLEGAQQATARWERVLLHLTRQTPQGVWLTSLQSMASDPKKPVTVSFSGMGASQDAVGGYILRLQNCPELENVSLNFTQEKVIVDGPNLEFQISGDVVGTMEEQDKEEDAEAKKA